MNRYKEPEIYKFKKEEYIKYEDYENLTKAIADEKIVNANVKLSDELNYYKKENDTLMYKLKEIKKIVLESTINSKTKKEILNIIKNEYYED